MTQARTVAVALAVLAAVLFGLAAVGQHGAVRASTSGTGTRATLDVSALRRLLRRPAWLLGALQATVAGASHLGALALAPITLVQPIGVLAVPVTVLGSALVARRLPRPSQLVGAVLGVAGVAALTVLLLASPSQLVVLPGWGPLLAVVVAAVAAGLLVLRRARAAGPLARCLLLSVTAAVLFGLDSVLLRTAGHLVGSGQASSQLPLLAATLAGIALALPVGSWAMQTGYTAGSPQVVICTLTLVDPVTAVVGGHLLLHDGVALSGAHWVGVSLGVVLAAAGVVLLSREQPAAVDPAAAPASS